MVKTLDTTAEEPFPSMTAEELIQLMAEHAHVYSDGHEIEISFELEGASHINEDGHVKINPVHAWRTARELGLNEEDAIRQLLNTLSHEIEHYNESDLASKKEMCREFPQAPKIAGGIINIVEDAYIDRNRLSRFEGLRKPFDHNTNATLPTHRKNIEDGNLAEATIRTLIVTFRTGKKPAGLKSPFLNELGDHAENWFIEAINADKQEERIDLARRITATVLKNIEIEEPPNVIEEELIDRLKEETDFIEDVDNPETICDNPYPVEDGGIEMDNDPEPEPDGDADGDGDGDGDADGDGDGDDATDGVTDGDGDGDNATDADADGDGNGATDADGDDATGKSRGNTRGKDDRNTDKNEDNDGTGADNAEKTDGNNSDADADHDIQTVTYTYDGDKFTSTNIGGGASDNETVTASKLSSTGLRTARNNAEELSEEVKEMLEKFEEERLETRQVNRERGSDLDIRKSVRYMAGDKTSRNIYRRNVQDEPDNRVIGITIDASGSMSGLKMRNALEATGALGKASEMLGDDLVANTFWSKPSNGADSQRTGVDWITRVNEKFDPSDLKNVQTFVREPIALGLQEIRAEMQKSNARGDRIIFVLHDGSPTILSNGKPVTQRGVYEPAVDEARDEVALTREIGFKVIGIAVGEEPRETVLDDIFGADGWVRFDPERLTEQILEVYKNQ